MAVVHASDGTSSLVDTVQLLNGDDIPLREGSRFMKIFYRVRPLNQEQIIYYDTPLSYWGEIFRTKICQAVEKVDSTDWSTWSLDDIDKMNHTSLLCAARSFSELADDVQIYEAEYHLWSERRTQLLSETDALSALVVE